MKYLVKQKLLQLLILIGIIVSSAVMACSSFVLKNDDNFVFGYNHDFIPDVHFYIMTNTRNIRKEALVYDDNPAKWTSKYGSITFNIGKEFPVAGMNEKGLVISLMALQNGGKVPEKDDRLSIGNTLSWIQYQLDNSASVEDIIKANKNVRCFQGKAIPIPLHYLVSDKKGNTAVIEFLKGELIVHTGDELPIPLLTNWKYDSEIKKLVEFINFKEQDVISYFGNEALNTDSFTMTNNMDDPRSIIGTYKMKNYQRHLDKPLVDSAFEILESMQMYSKKDNSTNNQLATVFDSINMQIYFYTKNNPKIRKLNFKNFDLITPSMGLMYSMDKNITDVKKDFVTYSSVINTKQIRKYSFSIAETFQITKDSPEYKRLQKEYSDMAKYPETLQYPGKELKDKEEN